MRLITALLLALAIAGCGTTYDKPGGSSAEFQRDLYDCEKDAAPQRDTILRDRMMDRCLQVRGWRPRCGPNALSACL